MLNSPLRTSRAKWLDEKISAFHGCFPRENEEEEEKNRGTKRRSERTAEARVGRADEFFQASSTVTVIYESKKLHRWANVFAESSAITSEQTALQIHGANQPAVGSSGERPGLIVCHLNWIRSFYFAPFHHFRCFSFPLICLLFVVLCRFLTDIYLRSVLRIYTNRRWRKLRFVVTGSQSFVK